MFNLRLLALPTPADLAREVAKIDPYPERLAVAVSRMRFHSLHLRNLAFGPAIVLKQELLSLDAACVISPAVYLGRWEGTTDVLIGASAEQLTHLATRLRGLGIDALAILANELDQILASLQPERGNLQVRNTVFAWGKRTYVMGIINATPDSFSGDGLLATELSPGMIADRALSQAHIFATAGADLLDVGGESTRPGAPLVDAEAEQARVVPVITALRTALDLPISIDTYKASVAAAALAAGADLVNDVWGLRLPEGGWNAELGRLVAKRGVPIILMHNRRALPSRGPQGGQYRAVQYTDLMADVVADLRASVHFALSCGIKRDQIMLDPGIGFGKTPAQNIELLRRMPELTGLGLPLLLGTSRKSFIGLVLGLPPDERIEGTAATVALGIQAGADMVRVHDVPAIVRTVRMTDAIVRNAHSLEP